MTKDEVILCQEERITELEEMLREFMELTSPNKADTNKWEEQFGSQSGLQYVNMAAGYIHAMCENALYRN